MIKRILLFLIVNFSALGIGSLCTKTGVASDWYQNLNKAPWTPPGWMFGVAWSAIMICFAVYMATLLQKVNPPKKVILLFALQWILNTSWNPIFFYLHLTEIGLFVIVSLTLVVSYFLFYYLKTIKLHSIWLAPYFIWMLIATSLNTYIVFMN